MGAARLDRLIDTHLEAIDSVPSEPWRLWSIAVMGVIEVMTRPLDPPARDDGPP